MLRKKTQKTVTKNEYIAMMSQYAFLVALGLGLMFASIIAGAIILEIWDNKLFSMIAIIGLMCLAVVTLASAGLKYQNFAKKNPKLPEFFSLQEIWSGYKSYERLSGVIGAVIIVAVTHQLVGFAIGFLKGGGQVGAALPIGVGVAGILLSIWIWASLRWEKFNIQKYNAQNAKQR